MISCEPKLSIWLLRNVLKVVSTNVADFLVYPSRRAIDVQHVAIYPAGFMCQVRQLSLSSPGSCSQLVCNQES